MHAAPAFSAKRITVAQIQRTVAEEYRMTVKQLLERTRRHAIAHPRQVAMYLATKLAGASLPDIGRRFGDFDHTTVMYARDRVQALLDEGNVPVQRTVEKLTRSLQASAAQL